MDWKFYVVGVANEIFKGTFKMQIWIEKNKAKKLLDPNPPKKTKTKTTTKDVSTKEEVNKDSTSNKDTSTSTTNTTSTKASNTASTDNTPPSGKTDPSASTVTVIPDPLNDKDRFASLVDGEVDLAKQALIIKQQELMAIQY